MEDIQGAAPGCLEAEPDLAFELHLARFHARAAAGDAAGAVALSRAALTPITQRHPLLVPRLKVRSAISGAAPQGGGRRRRGHARVQLQPKFPCAAALPCCHTEGQGRGSALGNVVQGCAALAHCVGLEGCQLCSDWIHLGHCAKPLLLSHVLCTHA